MTQVLTFDRCTASARLTLVELLESLAQASHLLTACQILTFILGRELEIRGADDLNLVHRLLEILLLAVVTCAVLQLRQASLLLLFVTLQALLHVLEQSCGLIAALGLPIGSPGGKHSNAAVALVPSSLGRQTVILDGQNLDLRDLLAPTPVALWRVLDQDRSLVLAEATENELAVRVVVVGVRSLVVAMTAQRVTAL